MYSDAATQQDSEGLWFNSKLGPKDRSKLEGGRADIAMVVGSAQRIPSPPATGEDCGGTVSSPVKSGAKPQLPRVLMLIVFSDDLSRYGHNIYAVCQQVSPLFS